MEMNRLLLLAALVLLGACASTPESISRLPHDNPSLTRVRLDPDAFLGRDVRWGGVIVKVENRPDETWIEIVRLDLSGIGKPLLSSSSDGRFIASFDRFLDPVVYEIGRPLTVVGKIDGKERRAIGEFDYLFPVVAVEGSYLWQVVEPLPPPYPSPWWYYDPWYPYPYPWPYYRHPRYY